MSFDDFFRISSHAVILNEKNEVLQLKHTYGDHSWGLPGGALDKGETIEDALIRECREEMGVDPIVHYLSGVYYHAHFNSHACLFKCSLPENFAIKLSDEHSDFRFFALDELSPVQLQRVQECIAYSGKASYASF